MENPNIEEHHPTPASQDPASQRSGVETMPVPVKEGNSGETASIEAVTSSPGGEPPRLVKISKGPSLPWITFLGIIALLLIAAVSAFGGYRSGINLRTGAEATQVAQQLDQQFALAQQDMADEHFDRARQRFEYIIKINPNYPGVTQKLAEVLLHMNATATPTIVPTPTVSPTPDLRGVEELLAQAQQSLANKDWNNTIDTLLTLRKDDPTYHSVDIDGMLYIALRNRGIEKIAHADLEGGIYDLTLAERFGPLDSEAQGFLTWTALYIKGASFWEIDWKQAVDAFAQVAPAYPSLMDGSGMTAKERYRQALIGYAESLGKDEDWCGAQAQYELSLSIGPDQKAEEALQKATKNCTGQSDEKHKEENPPPEETEPPVVETQPPVEESTPYPAPNP